RPAVELGRAVRVLARDGDAVRSVVDRPRAALVLAVLRHQQLALQRVIVRRAADAVGIAESPGHGLDGLHRVRDLGTQDRPGAHAWGGRILDRGNDGAGTLPAVVGIAARHVVARVEHRVGERDLLARDVVLVAAAAVVVPGH